MSVFPQPNVGRFSGANLYAALRQAGEQTVRVKTVDLDSARDDPALDPRVEDGDIVIVRSSFVKESASFVLRTIGSFLSFGKAL